MHYTKNTSYATLSMEIHGVSMEAINSIYPSALTDRKYVSALKLPRERMGLCLLKIQKNVLWFTV